MTSKTLRAMKPAQLLTQPSKAEPNVVLTTVLSHFGFLISTCCLCGEHFTLWFIYVFSSENYFCSKKVPLSGSAQESSLPWALLINSTKNDYPPFFWPSCPSANSETRDSVTNQITGFFLCVVQRILSPENKNFITSLLCLKHLIIYK